VPESRETIVGRERIRHVLAELIAKGSLFESQVSRSVIVDDIALLYTNFRATIPGADEKAREVQFRAIEILRPQQDGFWKLIVGDPNARK
jgi:ketosteroid isomerase-like protein